MISLKLDFSKRESSATNALSTQEWEEQSKSMTSNKLAKFQGYSSYQNKPHSLKTWRTICMINNNLRKNLLNLEDTRRIKEAVIEASASIKTKAIKSFLRG